MAVEEKCGYVSLQSKLEVGKDIPVSLLKKKKIREITVKCTFEN